MEYYIMKRYQQAKKEDPDVEQGFSRFSKKQRWIVYICFLLMVIFGVFSVVAPFIFVTGLWSGLGLVGCISGLVVLVIIDSKDEKRHLEKYANSFQKKLRILNKILHENYGVCSKEKVNELIMKYQKYIEKKDEEEKRRNKIIISLLSGFSAVVALTIENLSEIGVGIKTWLIWASVAFFFIALFALWLYSAKYFETLKRKYEMMVDDLQDLLFLEYDQDLGNACLLRIAECDESQMLLYQVFGMKIEEQDELIKLEFVMTENENMYYIIKPEERNDEWIREKRCIIEQLENSINEKRIFYIDKTLWKGCILSKGRYKARGI